MKKTSTRTATQRSANTLPVSKKFYAALIGRVKTACAAIGSDDAEAVNLIENYIMSGTLPTNGSSNELLLIFTLLRPEIDKAINRSVAARRRAAQRAADKAGQQEANSCETEAEATLPDSASDAKEDAITAAEAQLNRRQRRLIQQLERRRQRKALRQNKANWTNQTNQVNRKFAKKQFGCKRDRIDAYSRIGYTVL